MLFGLVALAAFGLVACWSSAPATAPTEENNVNVQNASTAAASTAATALPTATQPITPTALAIAPLGPQAIFVDAPPAGTLVGSPMQLKGRTQRMPVGGKLGYQVLDANGRLLHSQDTSALEATKDYDPAAFRKFLVDWAPR